MWEYRITLGAAGFYFHLPALRPTIEPIGATGARIKWGRVSHREIRLEIFGSNYEPLSDIHRLEVSINAELVSTENTAFENKTVYVLRLKDPRRHIVIVTKKLDSGSIARASLEVDATDVLEVQEEWRILNYCLQSLSMQEQSAASSIFQVSPKLREHNIEFDFPINTGIQQWAYGMAQLRTISNSTNESVQFGVFTAKNNVDCHSALMELSKDRCLTEVHLQDNRSESILSGIVRDDHGKQAALYTIAKPVNGNIAFLAASLTHHGPTMPAQISNFCTQAASTVHRLTKKPSFTKIDITAMDVLNQIDTVRHRVRGSNTVKTQTSDTT